MSPKEIFQLIKDKDVKFVDFRFTDTRGKEQHVSVPVKSFGPDKFESGHIFDGSSIAGWKGFRRRTCCSCPTRPRPSSIHFWA